MTIVRVSMLVRAGKCSLLAISKDECAQPLVPRYVSLDYINVSPRTLGICPWAVVITHE